ACAVVVGVDAWARGWVVHYRGPSNDELKRLRTSVSSLASGKPPVVGPGPSVRVAGAVYVIDRHRSMVDGKGQFHAVRFYYDSVGLCQIVADFIAEGLNAGQPGVVVATPAHAARIESFLRARGFDIAALKRSGD